MADVPSVRRARRNDSSWQELQPHRDFIEQTTAILACQRAFGQDASMVYVYRELSPTNVHCIPELQDAEYGRVYVNDRNHVVAETGDGQVKHLTTPFNGPQDALSYLNELYHQVQLRQSRLEIEGSDTISPSTRTVKGQLGHLIRLYGTLRDSIKHEHFRQRDLVQGENVDPIG